MMEEQSVRLTLCVTNNYAQHGHAIPLSMVRNGGKVRVQSISGKDETRRFLNNLGIIEDAEICVISEMRGNVIVSVKGTRIAISRVLANRVLTVW